MMESGAIQNTGAMQGVYALNNVSSANKAEKAAKADLKDPVDKIELSTKAGAKEEASTGKKIGLGVASLLLPGLGQCINEDYKKGAVLFGAAVLSIPAAILAGSTLGIAGLAATGLARLAMHGYSAYDAAVSAKA